MNGQDLGRLLIVVGLVVTITGVVVYFGKGIPWLGRLPGDIRVERPGFSFYFPLTTGLLVSIVLSVILYVVTRRP